MSLICWDTMLFVYWLEDHPQYAVRVQQIFDAMEARGDSLCTSALTAGELLAGAKKQSSTELAERIQGFFSESGIDVLPFTLETAEWFAEVRASHGVDRADVIHLASAAQARAAYSSLMIAACGDSPSPGSTSSREWTRM